MLIYYNKKTEAASHDTASAAKVLPGVDILINYSTNGSRKNFHFFFQCVKKLDCMIALSGCDRI